MRHDDKPAGKGTGRPPADPARRGRWIVTVAIVSAATGGFLLLGGSVAGGLRHYVGVPLEVLFVLVLATAVAGVWVGAWLSCRLTAGDAARYKATGIGGTVGLAVAIGLGYASTKILPGILPLLAILSPGFLAAIGAGASERSRPAAEPSTGSPPPA